ncbi:MAG TPA: endolytic transglycosylase MltG [Smithellaceae bacterium]|nr:endolytic transglycosylase MltG [Smithellaceae bacterium]
MKKMISKILLSVCILPCIAAILFGVWLFIYAKTPIDAAKVTTVLVDIPTGTSFVQVTKILSDVGLVENRLMFYSLVAVKRGARSIRAGEYEFTTALSPAEVVDKLVHGDIKKYSVTIHEDYSLKEIAVCLKEDKLIDEKAFFELAEDKVFLSSVGVRGQSIEGYLFPDTYFFNRSMTTRQIMRTMVDRFWSKVSPEMINKAAKRGWNPHQFVTFASLIGKESGNSAEKPMIAAVFYNRMKKGMHLQSDPTAVYDMKDFNGKVLRSHYRRESPYNTYMIKGLPPGPIANPGLDSFRAVLNPAAVDYLFFVSQRDGTHFFSSSLEAHNEAVLYFRNNIANPNEHEHETTQ